MSRKVYHFPYARSVRVLWLLEELGLDYETISTPLHGMGEQPAEFGDVTPMKRVPALVEGTFCLSESLAIMDYLLGQHTNDLAPGPSSEHYGPYRQWFHFGEATMGPYITMAMAHNRLFPEERRIPAMAKWGAKGAAECFAAMAKPLNAHEYLLPTGFSAADISCGYMMLLAKLGKCYTDVPPAVDAWWSRLSQRPAWKKATA